MRTALHRRYVAELTRQKRPYVLVSGSVEARIRTAVGAVDRLFA